MIRPSMLLAAMIAFAPMALADDGARSQRGQANQAPQQGGITGVITESLPAPDVAPTPVESLPVESAPPTEVPIVESEAPIALPTPIQKQQSMDRANTLPALGTDQLPPEQVSLGQVEELGTGNQTGQIGGETPIVDLPAQGGVTEQQTQTRAEPAKKPGFFKRMWTKVKGFFAGIKNKLTRKKAPSASQDGEVRIQDEPSLAPGGSDGPGAAPVG